jgi:hypothetical protein
VHAIDAPRETPTRVPLRPHLARAALLVAVLGILPFVLDAHVVWQVLGPLVAVAILSRSLQLVWREVFSTDPRHVSWG